MTSVEEYLTTWAARATRQQRRAGPTLQDLGGITIVRQQADRLATGPLLPYLIQALGHALDQQEIGDLSVLHTAVLAGLRQHDNHAAFTGAADALAARPALARALGPPLIRVLLSRLTDAVHAGADLPRALIGAEAADCLVQLTLAGVATPARLLGAMDEVTEDPAGLPHAFASRLPRLLGVLDAHQPGAGLYEALERFLQLEHTCHDAAVEMALADLRQALEHDSYPEMADHLRRTRRRLAEVLAHAPQRLDAQLYHAALDAVLSFSAPDAATRVAVAAGSLRESLQRYRSWRRGTATPSWAAPRQASIAAWAHLAAVVQEAARHLDDDDPWFAGGQAVLPALLNAYTAHHTATISTEASASAAAKVLIAPDVEDAFLRRQSRLQFLAYALAHDEQFRENPAARQLQRALNERARLDAPTTNQQGEPDQGKVRRWHLLATTLSPADFAHLLESMPDSALNRLELALRSHDDVYAALLDPTYGRLWEQLIEQLSRSSDWIPDIADPFSVLLETTIRFAYLCYDIGRKMGGSYTEYLRLRDKDGKKQKVDEALFHQHYREVIAVSALFRIVNSEVIDKGGGRADILFSFGPVQFNVECKIEEDDATEAGLRFYVAQAAEYQNTSASFAILLVLDKTLDGEGAPKLFESVWVEQVKRRDEREPCAVVIVRVPGGRDNPNQLRPPAQLYGAS